VIAATMSHADVSHHRDLERPCSASQKCPSGLPAGSISDVYTRQLTFELIVGPVHTDDSATVFAVGLRSEPDVERGGEGTARHCAAVSGVRKVSILEQYRHQLDKSHHVTCGPTADGGHGAPGGNLRWYDRSTTIAMGSDLPVFPSASLAVAMSVWGPVVVVESHVIVYGLVVAEPIAVPSVESR
jgi:hypothetical protein